MIDGAARVLAIAAGLCWAAGLALILTVHFSFPNLLPGLLPIALAGLVWLLLKWTGPPQLLVAHAGLVLFCWHWTQPRSMVDIRNHQLVQLALSLSLGAACLGVASLLLRRMPRVTRFWSIVVLFFATSVALLSSPAGGAQGWAEWLNARFGVALYQAETMVSITRESIHFLFYGAFAYAAYRLACTQPVGIGTAASFALLTAMSHGAFDEIRQSYLRDRSGHAGDILLDVAGAATIVYIVSVIDRRRQSRVAADA